MEKKPLRTPDKPSASSGEFEKARPMSEPVRKGPPPAGEQAGHLVLDFDEFGEADPTRKATVRPPAGPAFEDFEPQTARYRYITSREQLAALLRGAVCFSKEAAGFDAAAFAERIAVLGMCTRDREEPHLYYFIEDKLGNQFRLYIDPEGTITNRQLRLERRVVLDFGDGRIGYLFPLAFQGEDRR